MYLPTNLHIYQVSNRGPAAIRRHGYTLFQPLTPGQPSYVKAFLAIKIWLNANSDLSLTRAASVLYVTAAAGGPVPSAALDFGPRPMSAHAKHSFASVLPNSLPPIPQGMWVRHTPTAASFPAQKHPHPPPAQWPNAPGAPVVTIPLSCLFHLLFSGGVQVPIPAAIAPLAIDLGKILTKALYG